MRSRASSGKSGQKARKTSKLAVFTLFESEETAQAYIKKHTARLKNLGVDEVTFTLFGVNDALTKINHGNLCR
ncbi:monooxygenase [Salmonella enterica subsp. enterica]|nr:monooxygenase [Salmonella enterica subsp. enterica]